jgi:plastocyanin
MGGEGEAVSQPGRRGHSSVCESSEVVRTKLIIVPVVALGLAVTGMTVAAQPEAGAGVQPKAAPAGPTITIKDFMYAPAEITARAGQAITITNNDGFNHTVTAKDGTFNLDVPANGTVTLTVSKAGTFPYSCTYHPGQHNPATITVS